MTALPEFLVYVAGPYSQPDPVENTHRAVRFATALYEASGGRLAPVVPHLSMLWHAITPMPYDVWIALDLAMVDHCDCMVRLPGASSGADGEVLRAHQRGIPVAFHDKPKSVAKYLISRMEVGS